MSHSTEFAVDWGDIDNAQVVYYPKFFHMFHRAFERWFRDAVGVPYPEVVKRVGFPSVRVETDFRKPLRYGDRVRIEVELVRLGGKSLTNRYTAYRLPDGELSATATVTTCCINSEFKATTIPDDLRERLQAVVAGQPE